MNLSEINFNPKYTEEEMEAALDFLSGSAAFSGMANFCVVGTRGEEVMTSTFLSKPCHRAITDIMSRSLRSGSYRSLVATEAGWKRRHKAMAKTPSSELVRPFFDWLTKESFAKRFFVLADIEKGFVVSADMYTPLLQNIMILTRHFYEKPDLLFETFNSLVAKGVPGDVAYPIAFNSNILAGVMDQKFQSYYSHNMTHLFSLNAFKNFVSGELGTANPANLNDTALHYRSNTSYIGGNRLFFDIADKVDTLNYAWEGGLVRDLHLVKEFTDALAESRKGERSAVYKAPNPFAKRQVTPSTPVAGEITCKEAIEILGPFLGKYLYQERKEQ